MTAKISKFALPVLVSKIVCAALVVASVCAAKASGVGATGINATPGTATAAPVPDKAMEVGLVGALLVKSIVPAAAPTSVGLNVMVKVQVPAGAIGGVAIGQVVVNANGPVDVGALRVKLAAPLLVSVTICDGLMVATVCGAKVTGAPVSVIAGTGATTMSVVVLLLVLLVGAVKLPGTTLKMNVPGTALCTLTVMVQLPFAGTKPIPNEKPPAIALRKVPQVLAGAPMMVTPGTLSVPPLMKAAVVSVFVKV